MSPIRATTVAALAAIVACAMAVTGPSAASAGYPSRLRMKAVNDSAAVLNMTDDVSFGTLSWDPHNRYVFDDDVTINGQLEVEEIRNARYNSQLALIEKMQACNDKMQIYDTDMDMCVVVSSAFHNSQVKDFIDGASYRFCLIMQDDKLRCWGYAGEYCMLGFGDGTNRYFPTENPMTYAMPLMRRRVDPRARMFPVAHTYYNTAVVRQDGSVWTVGYGGHGVNGDNAWSNRHYWVPTDDDLQNVTAVVGGGHSTETTFCALTGAELIFCWGYNNAGQCGVGHTSNLNKPTRVLALTSVRMLDQSRASTSHTCAVRHEGSVWCWGYGNYGQIGNGGTSNRDSPAQVSSSVELYITNVEYIKIHGGSVATVFALKKDKTLWAWGYSGHGQTGTGTTSNQKSAFQVMEEDGSTLDDVRDVYPSNGCQYGSICALKYSGTVHCWGYNNHGQIGAGDTTQRTRARQVNRISNVIEVNNPPMIEHSYAYHNVCALQEDGTVWCWGYNNYGQLGLGHTSQQYQPEKVRNVGFTQKLGSRSYHSSNGDTTMYALSKDGYTIWAWGYNGHGQTGNMGWTTGTCNIPQKVRLE